MLTIRELAAGYGSDDVLQGISLDIGQGEVLTMTGANGSGKTTLIRCITGELKPSSGNISLTADFSLLPQQIPGQGRTVWEFLYSISPEILSAYKKMREEGTGAWIRYFR